jgi:flagellar hook protein FlgE
MMRSLYSAISGLKNHQVKMDVIGNNIANVNTTGFKRSRVTFSTMLSQNMKGASAPSATQGGTNPVQVGLGSMLGSIDQVMTQGSSQSTGKDTDVMIQGSGFFVLDNGGKTVYSRSGAFSFDSDGTLIDPGTGSKVQGYSFQLATAEAPTWPTTADPSPTNYGEIVVKLGDDHPGGAATELLESFSIDQSGVITGVYTDTANGQSKTYQIAQIALAGFPNDAGLANTGNNFYVSTNNSGIVTVGAAGEQGRGTLVPSAVEMSNVDLSQEFTDMIVTQRGFQANSRVITVSDSLLQELIDLKRG